MIVRRASFGLDVTLAFYVTAGIFLLLANLFPIVQIQAGGIAVQATLIGTARALYMEHMKLVALVLICTTVIVPAIDIISTTLMLALARFRNRPQLLALLFRVRQRLTPWNMIEIFVLGALVAVVKLGSIASVVLGIGLWSLAAFMLAHATATHAFEPRRFWSEIEGAG